MTRQKFAAELVSTLALVAAPLIGCDSGPADPDGASDASATDGGAEDGARDDATSADAGTEDGDVANDAGIEVAICAERCATDSHCGIMVGGELVITPGSCVEGACLMIPEPADCSDDDECRARENLWNDRSCTSSDDCVSTLVCIDYGGATGGCAIPPGFIGEGCALGLDEQEMPLWGTGTPVPVCVSNRSQCTEDGCQALCSSDADCPAGDPPIVGCNLETQQCSRCLADAACGALSCVEGECRCSTDAQCEAYTQGRASRCHNGQCTCTGASCDGVDAPDWAGELGWICTAP